MSTNEFSGTRSPQRRGRAQKHDADKLAFTVDALLSPEECARLVDVSNQRGYEPAALINVRRRDALDMSTRKHRPECGLASVVALLTLRRARSRFTAGKKLDLLRTKNRTEWRPNESGPIRRRADGGARSHPSKPVSIDMQKLTRRSRESITKGIRAA